ncbi:MAG: UDP-N-acetylmuramate dehydrogenase [Chloroflexi bacterium]|nr:UDP-N-acetylmuramate dehydrogenase [Chloroflexota bacterium]MDA1145827.1 UDP-N-acetylmuramate dehydrogenase [Chloroflexota bacterium]
MARTLPEAPPDLALRRDEPLARHTYLRLGGPAAYFGEPTDLEALRRIAAWAATAELPLRVLGGGSNTLIAEAGVTAVVLSLRAACGNVAFEGARVTAGSGVMLPALARAAAAHDLGGLEFAIGIPGTVGGALQSNAGIGDGRDIGGLVEAVDILEGGAVRSLGRDQLEFGYRTTSLRGSGAIVLAATLRLEARPRAECEAEMTRLLDARQASQPTAERNAGSIFRNPDGDHAGRLIEAAGCKGLTVGGARVSELHANFIVHDGTAIAADVAALMLAVRTRVAEDSGVTLAPEVEWWGDGVAPEVFR